jgi:hypothetical protein
MIWKAGESEKYSKKKKRVWRKEKKRKEKKNTSTIHIRQKNIVVGFAVIEL